MTSEQYFEKAKFIWQNYVPQSGQSEFVQGELLRAVEKLRDEAHRNGNGNWDEGHVILANFLRDTLINSECFNSDETQEIDSGIARLLQFDNPYMEYEIYDKLSDRVVDYFVQFPEPIKNQVNENLHR